MLFVLLTFSSLVRKQKLLRIQNRIQRTLEVWISKILLNETEENDKGKLPVPLKFMKHFKNKAKRDFTIKQLIDIKKNVTGDVTGNIIDAYQQLGFKKDSIVKFHSNKWYKKTQGIYQLYMMEQKDLAPEIFKLVNSHNEFVRMEAQTALIHFSGFEGLEFLDIVTHPISDWEQVQLLEQLKPLDFIEMNKLGQWLISSNDTVVLFALRLADVYQQFQVHDEVVKCLEHNNEKVRVQAVITLCRIANDQTASILIEHYYHKEYVGNRQNMLNCLLTIATDNEKKFLIRELNDESDFLKLAAARVLVKCCTNGLEILVDKARLQPDPYQNIYFHIKSELQL